MKKLMAIGAMLALMMMLAIPALADDLAVAGDVTLDFVDASQAQAVAAQQIQRGDADAGNVSSAAAIDQSLDFDQSQVNGGWDGVAASGDITVDVTGVTWSTWW